MPSNGDIVRVLRELATLTTLDDGTPQSFRVRAYEAAVLAVAEADRPLEHMSEDELVAVKGIGQSIAAKIRQYLETGTIDKLEQLRARYPPALVELTRIPGLGPKKIETLRAQLGVESIEDLQAAIASHALREVPGLGAKTEANLARAIERLGLHGKERRRPIAEVLPLAAEVAARLADVPGVQDARYGGSVRRLAETIGDVDVVAAATRAQPVREAFVQLPLVDEVLAAGDTKASILTREGLQIDLRVVAPDQLGAALLYFTGSKVHNIKLRQRAIERGWTLNEYALAEAESGATIAADTEAEIYAALGLQSIPPPLREDLGEIELAARGELPELVTLEDIRGDLHDHTDLSGDGRSPLEEMIEAALAAGRSYLAITDHGENLAINGVGRSDLLAQRRRLRRLAGRYPEITLLHGCELNIDPDGGLDYDAAFLRGFDWCVASVHSHFDLPQERQTQRVITAMRHPAVNAIGHLTGRMIGTRPGIELEVEAIIAAAVETGTALEINGALDRLDVPADVLRRARGKGATFVISTDSHHPSDMARMRWGVLNAQRGWVEREAVANTWPVERFLAWASARRQGR